MSTPLQDALESIAANVRDLRERARMTQAQLAEKADLDLRTVQRVEAATMNLRVGVLVALAGGLDVPPGRLLWHTQLVRQRRGRPTQRSDQAKPS